MNITGKYLKVWKVKENNGYKKLDLGDSKKNKDGEYDNWTWFDCLLVGNAKTLEVREQDTIEIKNGIISQEKYNDKWYTRIVIFDAEVMGRKEPVCTEEGFEGFVAFGESEDIPFIY